MTLRLVTTDPEDEALYALSLGDHSRVLSVLMRAYGEAVYSYCFRVLRSRSVTDDVHQTVFVQAFRDIGKFNKRSSFRSWIFAIAHNRCLDQMKKERCYQDIHKADEILQGEPDPSPSSEEQLVKRAFAVALDECLGNLNRDVRMAVLLRYMEGFTYEEMARICGENPATLQARVARALPVLRKCLEGKGLDCER